MIESGKAILDLYFTITMIQKMFPKNSCTPLI